jgi:hypothetical protein
MRHVQSCPNPRRKIAPRSWPPPKSQDIEKASNKKGNQRKKCPERQSHTSTHACQATPTTPTPRRRCRRLEGGVCPAPATPMPIDSSPTHSTRSGAQRDSDFGLKPTLPTCQLGLGLGLMLRTHTPHTRPQPRPCTPSNRTTRMKERTRMRTRIETTRAQTKYKEKHKV